MTQEEHHCLQLCKPPHFQYSQPNPLYIHPRNHKVGFILFTPNSFDESHCLYKYDILQNKYIPFGSFNAQSSKIKLSAHYFNPHTNEIYVFGESETPLFGIYNLDKNKWSWNFHAIYKQFALSMGYWIHHELHLYVGGIHTKYVPSTKRNHIKKFYLLNDKNSTIFKAEKSFSSKVGQFLQSSKLILIETNKLLLLPGDKSDDNVFSIYLYVVNDNNNRISMEYQWKKCKMELPKGMVFGGCNKCIVALECILIIFEDDTDVIWFCDLKNFVANKEYKWIKTKFTEKLPSDHENEGGSNYRIGLNVVLTNNNFIHFIKAYGTDKCESFHIQMSVFQLFPQELTDKYVNPMIYGYLRQSTNGYDLLQTVSTDIYRLIYSFAL
eukprot:530533_1